MVCGVRPLNKEKLCTRLIPGGDILEYDDNTSLPLLEANLLLSSVIFNVEVGARFTYIDLKDIWWL